MGIMSLTSDLGGGTNNQSIVRGVTGVVGVLSRSPHRMVHPAPRCCGYWQLIAHACTLACGELWTAGSWRCGRLQILPCQKASWPMTNQSGRPTAQLTCLWASMPQGSPDIRGTYISPDILLSSFLCLSCFSPSSLSGFPEGILLNISLALESPSQVLILGDLTEN